MVKIKIAVPVLLCVVLLTATCGPRKSATADPTAPSPTFGAMAYQNDGKLMTVIVSTRAARIAGPQEYLPLHLAILNKNNPGRIDFTRESFTLEYSDENDKRVLLPLADEKTFEVEYPRYRVDLRIGVDFIETLNGRYPSPPFTKLPLEFYSIMQSGIVPRLEFSVRNAEIGIGYLYFRLPSPDVLPPDGECRLVFKPSGFDEPLVVDLWVYKEPGK